VKGGEAVRGPTDYPGIDYGMGNTNIDPVTKIRYGVINMNALNEWAWDSFEADYGEPTCPKCGNECEEYSDQAHTHYDGEGSDYACEECKYAFMSDESFGDEPHGWTLDDGEYKATVGSDNDCFVLKSPYFTRVQFCSPCAPGAGHLENPCRYGPRTYCLGLEFFEDNGDRACPYTIWEVATGKPIYVPLTMRPEEDENES
jgi:hypothetical protein